MTLTTGTLPYDLANLLGGAARVIISDDAVALPAIPANLKDVFAQKSPYTPLTGWVDIGATTDSTDYSRDLTSSGYDIQQVTGSIFEEITDTQRTLKVAVGELKPEWLKIMEEAPSIGTIAATTGAMAQKSVKFGSIVTLRNRRVCFVGQRNQQSGIVDEVTGGVKRGRFVAWIAYNVTISADATQVQVQKGSLASMPITFKSFPEAGQPQGQEFGTWLTEDAGTMS